MERRKFIRNSASSVLAGLLAPSFLQSSSLFANRTGANDKINVGLIGCRSMGWANLSDFLIHPEID
ncbi:MAG: gfo/Idh/MocA family oxidoreductase, partial [Petrimonas sp.]|nr:gfo/Idh/MocA family oxidoreductase [Petrimonas sp.]